MADHFRDATKKVDFISREAALACVCQDCSERKDCLSPCVDYCRIKDIPAADVRPVVRGRWEDETGYIFNLLAQRVYCPVCKSHAYFYPITTKNFCPNCGAEMEKMIAGKQENGRT